MGIAVVGRFYIQLFSAFEPTQCATKPSIVEHNNNVHNLADVMGFTVKQSSVVRHRNALLALWALL